MAMFTNQTMTCPKRMINFQFRVLGSHMAYALNKGQTAFYVAFIQNASLMP